MIPRGNEVDKALAADLRVQALDELGALGRNAPVALAGLAGAAQVAAQRKQGGGRDIGRVRAERNSFQQVGGIAHRAADHH